MIDGNLHALRQHENEQEKQEVAYDALMKELEDRLSEIKKLIYECCSIAEDYDGYDFTEDVRAELEILL